MNTTPAACAITNNQPSDTASIQDWVDWFVGDFLPKWIERAARMRSKDLEYFYDQSTGTIVEFIAPELTMLADREGKRREIGHQCEWAWLPLREAELGGDYNARDIAKSLLSFADNHGFASRGVEQAALSSSIGTNRGSQGRFMESSVVLVHQSSATVYLQQLSQKNNCTKWVNPNLTIALPSPAGIGLTGRIDES